MEKNMLKVIRREKTKFRVYVLDNESGKICSASITDHHNLKKEDVLQIIIDSLESHKGSKK
jgi:hypothetical protein